MLCKVGCLRHWRWRAGSCCLVAFSRAGCWSCRSGCRRAKNPEPGAQFGYIGAADLAGNVGRALARVNAELGVGEVRGKGWPRDEVQWIGRNTAAPHPVRSWFQLD